MAIKDMVKELTGKTLDRYNRKIGLGEIGVNDPTQDKILNGIYSQVDYGYLSKTEQSSVLHLEGSGDGVVEVESVEGNSLVNLSHVKKFVCSNTPSSNYNSALVKNKKYTFITTLSNVSGNPSCVLMRIMYKDGTFQSIIDKVYTTNEYVKVSFLTEDKDIDRYYIGWIRNYVAGVTSVTVDNTMILEGDWTDKEIPQYFTGLQSSFEEKKVNVNGEEKYEIEVLSNNKNLVNPKDFTLNGHAGCGITPKIVGDKIILNGTSTTTYDFRVVSGTWNEKLSKRVNTFPVGSTITMSSNLNFINYWSVKRNGVLTFLTNTLTIQEGDIEISSFIRIPKDAILSNTELCVQIEHNSIKTQYIPHKLNKIKLLVNEPLRGISSVKDRLCIKDNKLVVERNFREFVFNGSENWKFLTSYNNGTKLPFELQVFDDNSNYISNGKHMLCDKFNRIVNWLNPTEEGFIVQYRFANICIEPNKLVSSDLEGFKKWLQANPTKVIYQLAEPFYEEVLNEYGEPILMEGYENGTLYIDSIIVPTTSVRYTQKNESLAAIGSINQNNTKTFSDISEDLIPYMMELDFMLMEAEMKSEGLFKMRRVEDLTSMQKRTGDMLARLIKGETLTKEEAFERVVVYLEAGRITQEQATELNLLIQETYRG